MAITWSATHKNARVTLSGANLVATADATGVEEPGRADTPITASQKIYLEIGVTQFDPAPNTLVGFGVAGMGFADNATPGFDSFLTFGCFHSGAAFLNSIQVASLSAFAQGDRVGLAFNNALRLAWLRTNAGNWNNDILANQNPATNTGGLSYAGMTGDIFPVYSVYGDASLPGILTGFLTAASFANPAPSGYAAYDAPAASAVETRYFALHKSRR